MVSPEEVETQLFHYKKLIKLMQTTLPVQENAII